MLARLGKAMGLSPSKQGSTTPPTGEELLPWRRGYGRIPVGWNGEAMGDPNKPALCAFPCIGQSCVVHDRWNEAGTRCQAFKDLSMNDRRGQWQHMCMACQRTDGQRWPRPQELAQMDEVPIDPTSIDGAAQPASSSISQHNNGQYALSVEEEAMIRAIEAAAAAWRHVKRGQAWLAWRLDAHRAADRWLAPRGRHVRPSHVCLHVPRFGRAGRRRIDACAELLLCSRCFAACKTLSGVAGSVCRPS